MTKKISVIIPIYNVETYLKRCISSVIAQNYENIEIILVDDGSTDNSSNICDEFAAVDSRIKVIHKDNGGLVSARKAGLEYATGEYTAFVDGDDWIDTGMFSEMLALCIENDADFAESGYIYHRGGVDVEFPCKTDVIYLDNSERERLIREWINSEEEATVRNTIWSKIYRTSIIKRSYLKINNKRSVGEDIINYLHLIKNSKKAVITSGMHYHYSFREDSLSHRTSVMQLRKICGLYCECSELIQEMYPLISDDELNIWFAKHTVGNYYKLNFDKESSQLIYKIENLEDLRNRKVVIYGAGNVGKDIYIQLCKYSDIKIIDWIDKNNDRYNYPYFTVHNASILPKLEYDIILIAVLREGVATSIKNDIIQFGCPKEKIVWKKVVKVTDQLMSETVGYNIVKILGGLGNQMFQYAFYRSLQERGQKVTANIDFFAIYNKRDFELPQVFPKAKLRYDEEKKFESYKNSLSFHEFYQETADGAYDAEVYKKTDCSFSGYWQTEKYFADIVEKIREEFKFEPKEAGLIQLAERIRSEKNSVSLHVRRGDYLETPEIYGNICTIEYYDKAIKYMKEKLQNPIFYVFSDDLEWTKENINLPSPIYICGTLFEDYQNWYDMFLMSCCHHNIIANSSFSWWGAWLNPNDDKLVVSPDKWLNGEETRDIWCDNWIRIG